VAISPGSFWKVIPSCFHPVVHKSTKRRGTSLPPSDSYPKLLLLIFPPSSVAESELPYLGHPPIPSVLLCWSSYPMFSMVGGSSLNWNSPVQCGLFGLESDQSNISSDRFRLILDWS